MAKGLGALGVGGGWVGVRDGKTWLVGDAWFMEYVRQHMFIEPAQLKHTALSRCINPKHETMKLCTPNPNPEDVKPDASNSA